MSYLKIKNRAASALAAGITATDTSLSVTTGEGAKFPDSGDFNITIEDEILRCTARSTDTLTVTRAQEGTTAAAHIAGKSIELRITAGVLESRTTWTLDKLLKGAGLGADPTEIDVPTPGATTRCKTADQDVSAETVQNDTDLYFPVGANEVWVFWLLGLYYKPATTASLGINWVFGIPTGATLYRLTSISDSYGWSDGTVVKGSSVGTAEMSRSIYYPHIYVGGANAGNIQFQFCINVLEAGAYVRMKVGSSIVAHKIS